MTSFFVAWTPSFQAPGAAEIRESIRSTASSGLGEPVDVILDAILAYAKMLKDMKEAGIDTSKIPGHRD